MRIIQTTHDALVGGRVGGGALARVVFPRKVDKEAVLVVLAPLQVYAGLHQLFEFLSQQRA